MNVKTDVSLCFNIGLKVCHIKVVINPVHHKVWEPWVLSTSLKELIEQFKTLLSKVVSEYLETHEGLVLAQSLSKESKTHVVNLIVTHIKMYQAFIHGNGLSDGFGTIV
jgi:hypothetical protein